MGEKGLDAIHQRLSPLFHEGYRVSDGDAASANTTTGRKLSQSCTLENINGKASFTHPYFVIVARVG